MPITVTLPTTVNAVGPGLTIHWASDFIGPLPSGTTITVQLFLTGGSEENIYSASLPAPNSAGFFGILLGEAQSETGTAWPRQGDTVRLQTLLLDNNQVLIDSGTVDVPWDQGAGVGAQVDQAIRRSGQAGGGLTAEQAQQLQETQLATFPTTTLDDVTLVQMSPGVTPGPVNFFLPEPTMMIIVRLANVPADIAPQTPDDDYWVKTLAVVRLFRGQDLWKRWPIHTSSKLITLYDENILAGAAAVFFSQWLLQLSVQVTFLPGVTGQVFISGLP